MHIVHTSVQKLSDGIAQDTVASSFSGDFLQDISH